MDQLICCDSGVGGTYFSSSSARCQALETGAGPLTYPCSSSSKESIRFNSATWGDGLSAVKSVMLPVDLLDATGVQVVSCSTTKVGVGVNTSFSWPAPAPGLISRGETGTARGWIGVRGGDLVPSFTGGTGRSMARSAGISASYSVKHNFWGVNPGVRTGVVSCVEGMLR
jgi:hypothetical protein